MLLRSSMQLFLYLAGIFMGLMAGIDLVWVNKD